MEIGDYDEYSCKTVFCAGESIYFMRIEPK